MTLVGDDGDPQRLSRSSDTQPLPHNDGSFSSHDQVVIDTQERKKHGTAKYGTALGPMNGRDSFKDAYEEALDLVAYMATAAEESREMRATMRAILFYLKVLDDPETATDSFVRLCERMGIRAE